MKLAITIPDPLFKETEAAAKDLRVSRSKLIQTALEEFLQRRRDAAVTESINRDIEKYGADLSDEDEAWLAHSLETVRRTLEEDEARATARGRRSRTLSKGPRRQS